ncbi:TPA: DUF4062 domain-containing protein [Yersinia enterocolitica]|uniref:DUF4062 domain-containing protein n=1 Tax=Yersinia enterocolitica TaxID=630 RepID=UPI0028B76C44|nr:DUF4062 domain-containing protein [Yersinia enterocolitica]EKN6043644.1 DUF4062 domain-containing protein [Yersinia enterocolitica]ELI8098714.1 DUF4062 domain-containing protein [Yersinia enterocolitica]HEN3261101.1 DUF4062 domain-containing protein [Yersinia enterocolitica]HEN3264653.1 DUF4062 domain-containing protein [Yersinia enterocolitica]
MNKRYQVFVSSTYKDLAEERKSVTQTLMEMDCIPAGMELFPAVDQEQFEFIKKVIDDSDYYIIVLSGKYGSISPTTQLSYTEMEYNYALEKGIKIIALVFKDLNELVKSKTETNSIINKKLITFRKKVCTGRLVKFWSKIDEIPGLVSVSLSRTITMFPATGWVKANRVANDELLIEMNDLRKENERLNKLIDKDKENINLTMQILKENEISIPIRSIANMPWSECTKYDTSLFAIFISFAPYLINESDIDYMMLCASFAIVGDKTKLTSKSPIAINVFHSILSDLVALDLVEPSLRKHPINDTKKYYSLSLYGKKFHNSCRKLELEKVILSNNDETPMKSILPR